MKDSNGALEARNPRLEDELAPWVRAMDHGACLLDGDLRIVAWSRGGTHITDYRPEDLEGLRGVADVFGSCARSGESACETETMARAVLGDGIERQANVLLQHRDGFLLPVALQALPVKAESGDVRGVLQFFADAREANAAIGQAESLGLVGFTDPESGILNRQFGEIHLRIALESTKLRGWPVGACLFGLANTDLEGSDGPGLSPTGVLGCTLLSLAKSYEVIVRLEPGRILTFAVGWAEPRLMYHARRLLRVCRHALVRSPHGDRALAVSGAAAEAEPADTVERLIDRLRHRLARALARGPGFLVGDDSTSAIEVA